MLCFTSTSTFQEPSTSQHSPIINILYGNIVSRFHVILAILLLKQMSFQDSQQSITYLYNYIDLVMYHLFSVKFHLFSHIISSILPVHTMSLNSLTSVINNICCIIYIVIVFASINLQYALHYHITVLLNNWLI